MPNRHGAGVHALFDVGGNSAGGATSQLNLAQAEPFAEAAGQSNSQGGYSLLAFQHGIHFKCKVKNGIFDQSQLILGLR